MKACSCFFCCLFVFINVFRVSNLHEESRKMLFKYPLPKTTPHGRSLTKQMAVPPCPWTQKSQLCQTRRGSKFFRKCPDFHPLLGTVLSCSAAPCCDGAEGEETTFKAAVSSLGVRAFGAAPWMSLKWWGSQGTLWRAGVPGARLAGAFRQMDRATLSQLKLLGGLPDLLCGYPFWRQQRQE